MIYIGIDPGVSGALAVLREGREVQVVTWDSEAYRDALRAVSVAGEGAVACVEKVHAMPKQGLSSTFNFGENSGFCQGLLFAFGIAYELVIPQKWQREFGVTSKNKSIEVCKRLFPGVNLRRTEKCRNDHDGMSDALLMAEYARRRL